jgi:integrase/recombinase XerD
VTSLGEGIEEFLVALSSERGFSEHTVAAYRRDLGQYAHHLTEHHPDVAASVDAIEPGDVSAFVQSLTNAGRAASTVARKIAAIRSFHRFLVADDLAGSDPTALVGSPRLPDALPKALTIEEVQRLLDSVDGSSPLGLRNRALLEFLYATGARVAEAVAVELLDVDLDGGTALLTGKGSKQRVVLLGRYAVDAIGAYLPARMELRGDRRDPEKLFLNARGRPLTRQGVWTIVRNAAAHAGIDSVDVSPHVLRHSVATHMVEGGADLRSVQEILGHASISTTQVYTRVSPRHLYEVYVASHPRSR